MAGAFRALARGYATLAVILFSVVLTFLGANALCRAYLGDRDQNSGIDKRYLPFELPAYLREEVYPGMSSEELGSMLRENRAIAYEYAPYREFQPKPSRGKYTNNSPAGFRTCKDQGPWPPSPENYNIFLFGGSTAYNVGVPQDDTIASHLQEATKEKAGKPVRVYNFGCPLFFSSPEGVLFERLIVAGHRPDLAIFLDGLNEYFHVQDEPGFSAQLGALFESSTSVPYHLRFLVDRLPVVQVFRECFCRDDGKGDRENQQEWGRKDVLESIQTRYLNNLKNIEAVACANGVKTLFVWQPVPHYKYKGYHPFQLAGFGHHTRSQFGYRMMADYVLQQPMPASFLWLADMQEGLSGMLYVDLVHYSGRMSKEIATRIAAALRDRGLME